MECVLFVFLIYFYGICAPTNICVSYTYTYMFAFAGRTAGPNWLTFFRETMGTMSANLVQPFGQRKHTYMYMYMIHRY